MPIETLCKTCGQRLRADEQFVGRKARCPACGTIYVVGEVESSLDRSSQLPDQVPFPVSGSSNDSGATSPGSHPVSETNLPSDVPYPSGPLPDSFSKSSDLPPSYFAKTPDGSVYGPADEATIDRWLREGRMNASCTFRIGESGLWRPMSEWRSRSVATGMGASDSGRSTSRPFSETVAYSGSGSPKSLDQPTNPYADASIAGAGGAGYSPVAASDQSGTILLMGILSWVLMCCSIGWIFALIGVILGWQEMNAIREGRVAGSNLSRVQIGFWLSVASLGFSLLGIVGYIAMIFVSIAANVN